MIEEKFESFPICRILDKFICINTLLAEIVLRF